MSNNDGYPKWAKDNTSTLPNDPTQQITRAKDANKGIAPSASTPAPAPFSEQTQPGELQQKMTDGSTDVVVSHLQGQNPQLGDLPNAKQHFPPCLNPRCKSFGKGHYGCLCYSGPGGTNMEDKAGWMAKGGVIGDRFCSQERSHNPKCEFYAEGGQIPEDPQLQPQFKDNTEDTVGHASVEHGLLGLLKDVGNKKLKDHEQHIPKLKEAMMEPDREKASEKLAGHPLTGSISPIKLHPIMDRMAGPISTQELHPDAFRNSIDYLGSSVRGHNMLEKHSSELFGNKDFSEKMEPDSDQRESLKKHLDEAQLNPNKLLDVGGSLGHYLPEHAAGLGYHAAVATNYLNSLKPKRSQNGPLDSLSPIDKMAESKYNRALDIAQKPLMVMYSAKEGTLLPQDITTLQTIYPGLHKSMVRKIGRELIEAKTKGIEIPYKQRRSISMLIGQPLDSTMKPQAMQAIIKANAGAQAPQSNPKGGNKKASGVELKQINKVNQMVATNSQDRLIDKNEK